MIKTYSIDLMFNYFDIHVLILSPEQMHNEENVNENFFPHSPLFCGR